MNEKISFIGMDDAERKASSQKTN